MHITRALRAVAAVAAVGAAVALAGCSSSSGGAEPGKKGDLTTVKVATIGLTSDGSLLTGIAKGFFADEGLKIETSIVANPPAGLAAAQSGQVDVAYSPSIPLLNALSQGVKMKVVGAADGYPDTATSAADPAKYDDTGLFASKASGITSVKELAGKTIAIPARKAQLEVVIAEQLKKNGIDPATGVKWVVLDFTSAVAALKSGNVDAAGLVSPFTAQAAADGGPQLAAPSIGFFETGATGLWTAGETTIQSKKDVISAFQRAIVKSNEYATAHAEEAITAGLAYTKSKLTVAEVKVPVWPTAVAPEDLQRPDDKMVALGFLKKPVDLSGVILAK
ncbi:NitT/TauT family transport system substrate-binding protein [Microbacterium azadirachtae]|uniref:NitT/TauT family transport system substrate-binding protein n=1 Tax=Microbacterium azadirachtae TaxID=582680 RepID=A0A1I6IPR4_9MICO|nr:ABC transporter substrate-binding protein [Microbacterium azadirachtae]SFR68745.1 NitT/TauT family transport system substrate-binding protein [Microbacterium azadirachtae]